MARVFEPTRPVKLERIGVVVSKYNLSITKKLLDGAAAVFREAGLPDDRLDVAWVPGAFELPLIADRLARGGAYQAVLCLGAVIRGETTHDQHINRAVSDQLAEIGVRWGVPVMFGVLTCDSMEQAIHRAGGKVGNKGAECAEAALDMLSLLDQLPYVPAPAPRGA